MLKRVSYTAVCRTETPEVICYQLLLHTHTHTLTQNDAHIHAMSNNPISYHQVKWGNYPETIKLFLPVHYHNCNYGKATMMCNYSVIAPLWCDVGEDGGSGAGLNFNIYDIDRRKASVGWRTQEGRTASVLAGTCESRSASYKHISQSMAEYQVIHLLWPVNAWHFPFIKAVRWNAGF